MSGKPGPPLTEAGHPLFACLAKLEFTKDAIAQWAKKSRCASAHVVSDGLWCFQAVTASGAAHERTVTGGGPARVKLETFRVVNTLLGNLKTAFSGTYHAFDFAKYTHRYLAEVGIAQPLPHGLERLAELTRPPVGDRGQTTRAYQDHAQTLQGQAHDHRLAQMVMGLAISVRH